MNTKYRILYSDWFKGYYIQILNYDGKWLDKLEDLYDKHPQHFNTYTQAYEYAFKNNYEILRPNPTDFENDVDKVRFNTDVFTYQKLKDSNKCSICYNNPKTLNLDICSDCDTENKRSFGSSKYTLVGDHTMKIKTFKSFVSENNIPVRSDLDKQIHATSATSPLNDLPIPSTTDTKKGNYQKGQIVVNGLKINIENPYGSIRKGVNKKGETWQTTLTDNYGEIHGYDAADGDYLDIFIRPHLTQQQADKLNVIYVVDQIDPETHEFDEHKVIFGYETIEEAKRAYLANYESGWTGLGSITPLTMSMFKFWIKNENLNNPLTWGK